MSKITWIGIALVTIAACTSQHNGGGGGGGGGGGSGSGSGSGSGGSTLVAPKIGPWNYSQVTLVTSTCNSSVNNGEAGNFSIDQSSTTSFHVLPNDGNMDFTCTLDHGTFDCPNRIAQVYDYRPSFDAVVTVNVDAMGSFSSTTRATGSQDATVDCTGTGCGAYGPFPCDFTQDFVIVAL